MNISNQPTTITIIEMNEPTEIANVWLMTPNSKNIQKVKYDFDLSSMFPNGYECLPYFINDITDYYIVFFDKEDGGAFNSSAVWVAPYCQVAPTGNFIIMRKKWFGTEDDYAEYTVEMNITPKGFKKLLK